MKSRLDLTRTGIFIDNQVTNEITFWELREAKYYDVEFTGLKDVKAEIRDDGLIENMVYGFNKLYE